MIAHPQLEPPEPWFRPEPRHSAALAAEARAEIGASHELAGHELTVVVKCEGCDEVIFTVDDGTFAQVHLTFGAGGGRSLRRPSQLCDAATVTGDLDAAGRVCAAGRRPGSLRGDDQGHPGERRHRRLR